MSFSTTSPPSSPTYSPASSPAVGPCDSSPPSSPSRDEPEHPLSLSPPSPGPAHPFAASTKGVRAPRLYERRQYRHDLDDDISFQVEFLDRDHSPTRSHTRTTSTLAHPLAASANAAWVPPEWEKKPRRESRALSTTSFSSADTLEAHPRRLFAPSKQSVVGSDLDDDAINLSDDDGSAYLAPVSRRSRRELEQEMWDRAIAKAIDKANGIIDLVNSGLIGSGLTRIPPAVADLASLVVLPSDAAAPPSAELMPAPRTFARAQTMPTNPFAPPLPPSENAHPPVEGSSMAQVKHTGSDKVYPLCMYLANNAITKLPLELFWLQGLTVLNLRGNQIRYIPPQIANLKNLQALVLSQNKLTYLPAEMLDMRLATLILTPNPWLKPPDTPPAPEARRTDGVEGPPPETLSSTSSTTTLMPTSEALRVVSETVHHFTIPQLMESCLRVLLSDYLPRDPLQPSSYDNIALGRRETVLEVLHTLPLPEDYPQAVLRELGACCAKAIAKPDISMQASPMKRPRTAIQRTVSLGSDVFGPSSSQTKAEEAEEEEGETHPGVGVCRSPAHTRPSVFVRHAEERFSWEAVIAGQTVDVDGGIPVLWRGCSRGCLDFLGGVDGTSSRGNV